MLASLCAESACYVGNDSGVSHLAAASGARALVLFGPTDPAAWGPRGERVSICASPTGAMADIDAQTVLQRLAGLLSGG